MEEPAAVEASKCNELLSKLQEAVEAENAADVLADVLPELTSEVSGIESAFGDIQAANVGLKDQADTLKPGCHPLNCVLLRVRAVCVVFSHVCIHNV